MADYDDLYAHLDIRFFMGTKFNRRKTEEARKVDASAAEVHDDVEMISIRFPGGKDSFDAPAHSQCSQTKDGSSMGGFITYAQKFHKHYDYWKEHGGDQLLVGTPIERAPFLSKGEVASLQSLKILTIEQLAQADDKAAKRIGPHAHDRIEKAQEYVAANSDKTDLVSELEAMKAEIARLKGEKAAAPADDVTVRSEPVASADQFDGMDKQQLRDWIKANGGTAVKGQPSEDTLRTMARDLVGEAA